MANCSWYGEVVEVSIKGTQGRRLRWMDLPVPLEPVMKIGCLFW